VFSNTNQAQMICISSRTTNGCHLVQVIMNRPPRTDSLSWITWTREQPFSHVHHSIQWGRHSHKTCKWLHNCYRTH